MKHQRLTYWCGVAAAANALECLGIHRDQEELATLCHVTKKDGTSEEEVMRALLACGAKVAPWDSTKRHKSQVWLMQQLRFFGPAILSVAHAQHWVTAIGTLKNSVWVFDPATGKGLEHHTWTELMRLWRLGDHAGGPHYYGIGVSK